MTVGIQETQQISNLADLQSHQIHWVKENIIQPMYLADSSKQEKLDFQDTSDYFGPCAGFVYEFKEGIWMLTNIPNYDTKLTTIYYSKNGKMMEYIAISYQTVEPNHFVKNGGTLLRTYKKREKSIYS